MTIESGDPEGPEAQLVSEDGRSFRFRAVAAAGYRVGDYLSLVDGQGREQLALIEALDVGEHTVQGRGSIFPSRDRAAGPPAPFRTDVVERSDPETVEAFYRGSSASLVVGRLGLAPEVRIGLIPTRMNRHTFWCGQSGSGKTYALGVALEQLLLHTRLPIVIFDPNSDFVHLNRSRPGADAEEAAALADREVTVLRSGTGEDALRVRFRSMSLRARAAVLHLDPLRDREEYHTLVTVGSELRFDDPHAYVPFLHELGTPGGTALAERLENLGVLDWQMWALDHRAVTDVIDSRPAATVLDLGGFGTQDEPLVVALAVLEELWARREERRPVLLVIDEAHNLCSPDLESPAARAVRDQLIQIAAEGRKFGLWLLLFTQRPAKVHAGIVSQCDNLTLMRMNSPQDLAELAAVFGFAPAGMLAQAARFRQGEALLAGGFVPAPGVITIRDRISVEGGVDVRVPMP